MKNTKLKNKKETLIRSNQDKKALKAFTFNHKVFFITNAIILSLVFIFGMIYYTSQNKKSGFALSNVSAGAEGNYGLLPPIPNSSAAATFTVSNGDQLRAVLNGTIQPGSVIELNDGTYTGGQFLIKSSTQGTSSSPIVIRAKNKYNAVISDCGATGGNGAYCFTMQSNFAVITGLTFTNTRWSNINVLGYGNRVTDNKFIDAGSNLEPNSGDFKDSIIGSYGTSGQNMNALIDNNYILRPKNIPFAISEQSYGITISHNTIEGPNAIILSELREANAFKIGCCTSANETAYRDNPIIIQFNTIKDFGNNDPYLGSSKVPYTRFLYNRIIGKAPVSFQRSFVWETRGAKSHSNIIKGNFFEDGAIVIEQKDQKIEDNIVLSNTGWYGVGPLVIYARIGNTNNYGVYDPSYYTGVANATIRNNIFVANFKANNNGYAHDTQGCIDVSNISLNNNMFLSPNSAGFNGCFSSSLNSSSGNNTIGNLSLYTVNNNTLNSTFPYAPELTKFLSGSTTTIVVPSSTPVATATPAPTPIPKSTPVPTVTPKVTPTITPTVNPTVNPTSAPTPSPTPVPTSLNDVEAEDSVIISNSAGPLKSNANTSNPGAGHTGYSGKGYVYSWSPQTEGTGIRFNYKADVNGVYKLTFRYTASAAEIPLKTIRVGTSINSISFPLTSNWDTWGTVSQDVTLTRGDNSIDVLSTLSSPMNGWLNLDKLTVDLVKEIVPTPTPNPTATNINDIEAEASTLLGATSSPKASQANTTDTAAQHTGYSGNGYIYNWQPQNPSSGVSLKYNASKNGIYKLTVRYSAAAADTPNKTLSINGKLFAQSISFPKTQNWDTWTETSLEAVLALGNNDLNLTSATNHPINGWLNLDKINITYVGPVTVPTPIPTPTPSPTLTSASPKPKTRKPRTKNYVTYITQVAGDSDVRQEVSGDITLAISPTDKKIARVDYFVDNTKVQSESDSPYQVDSTLFKNGNKQITQRILYDDGTSSQNIANITIANKETPVVSQISRYFRNNKLKAILVAITTMLGTTLLLSLLLKNKSTIFNKR